ncbi:MAG: hypothetical protein RR198_03045 [Oscillospiraceae bacterium]
MAKIVAKAVASLISSPDVAQAVASLISLVLPPFPCPASSCRRSLVLPPFFCRLILPSSTGAVLYQKGTPRLLLFVI